MATLSPISWLNSFFQLYFSAYRFFSAIGGRVNERALIANLFGFFTFRSDWIFILLCILHTLTHSYVYVVCGMRCIFYLLQMYFWQNVL